MAGKCYNKPRHVCYASCQNKPTKYNRNLEIFARHVYAGCSSILCRYLKYLKGLSK